MKEIAPNIIKAFSDGPWLLEISDEGETYGSWLSHNDLGHKEFVFGAPKTQQTLDEFVQLVLFDIDEYKEQFDFR